MKMFFWQICLHLFVFFFDSSVGFAPSEYAFSTEITPSYKLYWNILMSSREIQIAIEAKTTGWVGFGIGEPSSGSMPGADIVTGYIQDGEIFVQDRFAMAKAYPKEDVVSHWKVIAGEERGGVTYLELRRKLDTGDMQDRPIIEGMNKVVVSWGTDDTFGYHGKNRKATAINFFNKESEDPIEAIKKLEDVKVLEFRNNNFSIPPIETQYYENDFVIPLDIDVSHAIALEAIIDPNTKDRVHHFLLFGCYDYQADKCTLLWGWAPGVIPLILPEKAGFRIGSSEQNSIKILILQTHFDNPDRLDGYLDNSGVNVYYTRNLREYDAAVLQTGDPAVTQPQQIPQGNGVSSFEYNCPSECTHQWSHDIHIFADMLHMHAIGSQIWSTLWRDGEIIQEIGRIDFWDFNFQQNRNVDVTIKKGDRINLHCRYKQRMEHSTNFSLGSRDEMCLEYLVYYPKLDSDYCGFYYDEDKNRNFTLCDEPLIIEGQPVNNPTEYDPEGGEEILFGTANLKPTPIPQEEQNSSSVQFLSYFLFLTVWVNIF